jgi:hypothetical protein
MHDAQFVDSRQSKARGWVCNRGPAKEVTIKTSGHLIANPSLCQQSRK